MTMEKNKVDQLEQIKFDQIEGILQILGLIETRGILFQKDNPNITQRTIEDFDGHTWEVFYMDITKFPTEQPAEPQDFQYFNTDCL